MITFLHGILADVLPNRITLDVQGIGYQINMPLGGPDALGQSGDTVRVLTHLYVREQELTLYGFKTGEERDLFLLLINRVSGVGPKVAMSILGSMGPTDFKNAVVAEDLDTLSRIKGLGKKTVERIVLELKDKVGVTSAWEEAANAAGSSPSENSLKNDAVLALISLGFKQNAAHTAVGKACKTSSEPFSSADDILRAALRLLQ
ncbi:MAG: Holliday junction branch migration protein RuvA [Verrucomicrobiales bacterium]|nr:Holliday junction branch migration protein RuvA [Verrucomicrobiales bacterium]